MKYYWIIKTKDVLTNVKKKKKAGISLGVTGDEMASYEDGLQEDFFRVDFNPASNAYILSLSEIEKKTKYNFTYKQRKHFRLHFKNKTNLTFKLRNGLSRTCATGCWVLAQHLLISTRA